jgi:propanediol utilization protein
MNNLKEEKPLPLGARVYKRHRVIIRKAARKLGVSEAEVVRMAIDNFEG